jgi:hypothetical protein
VSAVTGNQIGDAGAQALAEALESNHTLVTLVLWSACFTAAIVAVLVAAVSLMCACEVVVNSIQC